MEHGKHGSLSTGAKVRDPVCGMEIAASEAAATRMHEGMTFYFCSTSCVKDFDKDPHGYAHKKT